MAKFPLEMANGVQARNLNELKDNFDLEKVIGYFLDGKLQRWLDDRYYEDESEKVSQLDKADSELGKKLCDIFDVDYVAEIVVDTEEIKRRNERIAKLKQFTDDDEIIKNVDSVAFNQEELSDLYDSGATKIYLCEGQFNIPKSKQELEYVELGGAKVEGKKVIETAGTEQHQSPSNPPSFSKGVKEMAEAYKRIHESIDNSLKEMFPDYYKENK